MKCAIVAVVALAAGVMFGSPIAGASSPGAALTTPSQPAPHRPPAVQRFECSDNSGAGYAITVHRFHTDQP